MYEASKSCFGDIIVRRAQQILKEYNEVINERIDTSITDLCAIDFVIHVSQHGRLRMSKSNRTVKHIASPLTTASKLAR